MTCWRCGRVDHAAWCSMPGGCDHCGWRPHRAWCAVGNVYAWSPTGTGYAYVVGSA